MVAIKGPNGVVVDVPGSIASGLVRSGQHFYVSAPATSAVEPVVETVVQETVPVVETPVVSVVAVPEQSAIVPASDAPAEAPAQPAAPVEAPRGNASRDEFAAYATALGIEFDAEASRDEIRALVAGKE
ncbi:hypothetical protein [Leucobacter sp. G161]|uniref:hypothetical protein n=1 Tax=Leucobacter sp. G161 TaxID=663704 RepID=UPI00073B2B44|nr:hypothetical protein [Leucobacter sp. G161]KUF07185.1 hypothetical protein AUL38_02545 [Leucobacter sp. G161]